MITERIITHNKKIVFITRERTANDVEQSRRVMLARMAADKNAEELRRADERHGYCPCCGMLIPSAKNSCDMCGYELPAAKKQYSENSCNINGHKITYNRWTYNN